MIMKEERAVKNPDESINFDIKDLKFKFSTFQDKGTIYTLIHRVGDDKEIKIDSPLIMQFENNDISDYYKFKKSFGNLKTKFIESLKDNIKIENQFVKYINSNIESNTKWFNPEYTFYEAPSNNGYKNSNYNKANGAQQSKVYVNDFKKCNEVKPVIALETLQKLGYISLTDTSPNTHGEEFWSYALSNSGVKFKTSVKTKSHLFQNSESLYDPMNGIFNDVYHTVKGYGKGSVGLISFLGDHGLFTVALPGPDKKNEREERAREFILTKLYPHIEEQDLANDHALAESLKGQGGSMKVISYSRMPFKNNAKINDIKGYLINNRLLSKELVEKLISDDLIYAGSFSANKLGQDAEHKFYFNTSFFRLTDRNGVESGAERLSVYDSTNSVTGEHYKKLTKFNTHPVMGNAFRLLSNQSQPAGSYIGEAVIDVLSAYELFSLAGINPNQFNYFSIQGCNNLNNFLALNAGFSIETNEEYRPFGEVYGVKEKVEKEKLSQAKVENYNKAFKSYDYYFINTNNEKCLEIMKKIPLANKILGTDIKIMHKNSRTDSISYNQFDKTKSVFLDETAFDNFFSQNNIVFEYESDIGKYKAIYIREKLEEVKLNSEIKNNILNTMMKNFGSTTLMVGLDYDEAGLKYRKTLNNIPEHLGIKVFDMYPKPIPGIEKTDTNNTLTLYKKLVKANKIDEANSVLEGFVRCYDPNFNIKKNKLVQKP